MITANQIMSVCKECLCNTCRNTECKSFQCVNCELKEPVKECKGYVGDGEEA